MNIKEYLNQNNISVRQMSLITAIPYSTLSDIVNERVKLEDCQYKTLKKIAVFLKVSIDDLVYQEEHFQTFRNNLHHELRLKGDVDVVLDILEEKRIDRHLLHQDMLKAMYLLSFIDYLSKKNNIPLCKEYKELRGKALDKPYYVGDQKESCKKDNCIEEFVNHNIFEGELYDAV